MIAEQQASAAQDERDRATGQVRDLRDQLAAARAEAIAQAAARARCG
ncbi:hypothetical protein [Nonomuraea sp. NPDC005692]